MKKFIFAFGAIFCMFALVSCGDDDKNPINPEIPDAPLPVGDEWIDPIFAQVLQERGYISNAENVTPLDVANIDKIDVSRAELTSVRGISYFTALKSLRCDYNQLTTLDVSKNTIISELWCEGNNLTQLDVSKNTDLVDFECAGNQLIKLDLSNNTKLWGLVCSDNKLSQLDVSKNTKLTHLTCHRNQLTKIDISNNKELKSLRCEDNPGANNKFVVNAWFDSSAIPMDFTANSWDYNGQTITIEYVKVK